MVRFLEIWERFEVTSHPRPLFPSSGLILSRFIRLTDQRLIALEALQVAVRATTEEAQVSGTLPAELPQFVAADRSSGRQTTQGVYFKALVDLRTD